MVRLRSVLARGRRCTGVIKCRATRDEAGGGVWVKFWVLIEYETDYSLIINDNWVSAPSLRRKGKLTTLYLSKIFFPDFYQHHAYEFITATFK